MKIALPSFPAIAAFFILFLTATAPAESFGQVTASIVQGDTASFCVGGNVTLQATVTPPGTYTYQWFRNSTALSGTNSLTYTASVVAKYYLRVTDSNSNIYYSDTVVVVSKALPTAPVITFSGPAILCGGAPVMLKDTGSINASYQWLMNNTPISGATGSTYAAATKGMYTVRITNLTTTCSNISAAVMVGKLPDIAQDTIYKPCGSGAIQIAVTDSALSFSTMPATCNVNMSTATIVTTSVGAVGRAVICKGGSVTINGNGSGVFVVESGGSLTGFAGGGSNTAYVKAGGRYTFNSGGGGGNVIYYEPGAILNPGTTTTVMCTNIGVIYPPSMNTVCNTYSYLWSTGDTTASINVNPSGPTAYWVRVSKGSLSCTDTVVVRAQVQTSLTTSAVCDSFSWNGQVYKQSGTYTYSTTAGNGCDSIATLQLTIKNTSSTETVQACRRYNWNNQLYTQSGTYTVHATNAAGCDSTAILQLTIETLSFVQQPQHQIVLEGSDAVFAATASNAQAAYQWQMDDGTGFKNIANGTADSLRMMNVSLSDSGLKFRCVISSGPCSDTSIVAVLQVQQALGISPANAESQLQFIPNPSNGEGMLSVSKALVGKSYIILNAAGQTVASGIVLSEQSPLSLSKLAAGRYVLRLTGSVQSLKIQLLKH